MGDPRCYCPGAARPDECGRVGAAVRVLLPNGQGGRGTDVLVGAANPRGHSPLHALALSRTANGADDPSETVRALGVTSRFAREFPVELAVRPSQIRASA